MPGALCQGAVHRGGGGGRLAPGCCSAASISRWLRAGSAAHAPPHMPVAPTPTPTHPHPRLAPPPSLTPPATPTPACRPRLQAALRAAAAGHAGRSELQQAPDRGAAGHPGWRPTGGVRSPASVHTGSGSSARGAEPGAGAGGAVGAGVDGCRAVVTLGMAQGWGRLWRDGAGRGWPHCRDWARCLAATGREHVRLRCTMPHDAPLWL